MEIIEVKTLPVIGNEEALKELKADIEARTAAVMAMECTEENRKEVKKIRAEFNKESAEYEARRKVVKKAVLAPYEAFEEVYKECVLLPLKNADIVLARAISNIENGLKDQKAEAVKSYAIELIAANDLTWLDYKRVMPTVTLSASEKSLKKAVEDAVLKIGADVKAIDDVEVFAEYKRSLDLADAQIKVRIRRAEIEEARREAENRKNQEETKQEVVAKVERLAPPAALEAPVQEEKTYSMTFTVNGTIEQLKAVKAFLTENNIQFTGRN